VELSRPIKSSKKKAKKPNCAAVSYKEGTKGQLLTEDQLKAIADLPSKEQLIAQAAGAINAIAAKLASSINEVPHLGQVPWMPWPRRKRSGLTPHQSIT
jgi:ribosomal protein L10